MADYKLRLEIDVKELEKQLLSIAKAFNAKIGGGANNAGPFSEKAVKNGQEQIKLISEMTQAMAKEVDISAKMFKMQSELLKQRHKERLEEQKIVELRQLRVGLLKQETARIRAAGSRESAFKSIGGLFGKPFGMGGAGSAAGAGIDMIIANLTKRKRLKEIDRKEGIKQARLDLLSTTKPSSYEELGKKRDTTSRTGWGAYSKGMQASPLGGLANIIPKQSEESKKQTNKLLGFFRGKGTDSKTAVTRDASKFGRLTDYMKKASRTFDKKTGMGKGVSKFGAAAGTPIKIAGIASGLLAGSGIGKMLIDSSPLLQSMMKLLNVGIMMILRPIGDFVGFMLRPLLIEFVKRVAVPMYKQGFQVAKKYGTQLGKMLLDLFTKPDVFFRNAIVNPLIAGVSSLWVNMHRGLDQLGNSIINAFNPTAREEEARRIDEKYDQKIMDIEKQYPNYGNAGISSPELQQFMNDPMGTAVPGISDNTTATTENTLATAEQTRTLQELIASNKAQHPEWFPGTPEYEARIKKENKEKYGYEDVTSYEEAIAKGQSIFAKMNQEKSQQARDEQMKYAIESGDYKGLTTAQIKEAEAARAMNRVKDYSKPYFGTGGYTGTQGFDKCGNYTSAERIADLGAGDRALAEAQLNARMEQIYGKERWAEMQARGSPTGKNYGSSQTSTSARGVAGSGGYYNPSTCDPISMGGINPATGRPITARDVMSSGRGTFDMMQCGTTEIPSQDDLQQLIVEPIENAKTSWIDGTSVMEEFGEEIRVSGEKMRDKKHLEAGYADETKLSSELIKDSFGVMEGEVDMARQYGIGIAEGLEELWERVQRALMKLSWQKSGNPPKPTAAAKQAKAAIAETKKVGIVDDTRHKYKLTYPSGETRILELDDNALEYYNRLRSTGSGPLSIIKMARGGIINEPILGFGQKTGRQYMMGENGPETVTPGANTRSSNTNSPIFNITINASNIGDVERQLKPAILKMLKESTARAGIV